MINIYEYLDYQQFLKDYVNFKKKEKPWFSYRYLASKLRIDHSNLIKILLGKRHLSRNIARTLAAFIRFNARETEYILTLVEFNKAKNQVKCKHLLEKLFSIRDIIPKKLEPHQYEYYQHWYYTAIYTILDYYEFRDDYIALARELNPPISAKQAREGIGLLEKLKLIEKDTNGRYVQTEKKITTGKSWHSAAIQRFQEETLKLALNSLDHHPKNVRDFSTLTMTISESDLEDIREITNHFRSSVIKVVHESEQADRVYQLNVQLFPMTKLKRDLL